MIAQDALPTILAKDRGERMRMMFKGNCVRLARLESGLVELCFDRVGEAINKLDDEAVGEFDRAVREIAGDGSIRGVLVTSAKDAFIVGADITEFGRKFRCSGEEVARDVLASNQIFVRFEDLNVPTVAAINGFALGGGLELALPASQRVMSATAQVGVPEVKLGLFPGFGGTVRLPRVASQRVAVQWVVSGKPCGAVDALQASVVDAVTAPDKLRADAIDHLTRCVEGQVDWGAAQQRKREPVTLLDAPAHDDMLARLAGHAATHQPAAGMAVRMMREAALCDRQRALELEAAAFGAVTQTQAANAMMQSYLNEQAVRKTARRHGEGARAISAVVVIGAGELADAIRSTIKPQPDDAGVDNVDLVIDVLAGDLAVKHQVLGQLQSVLKPGSVIASSTSRLRIDDIAASLPRPADVVGLHFFGPVAVAPLVEVVRGSRSSDAAVATATAYVRALGKIPVVVKDCPGFLVNRVFKPYLIAFCRLVAEVADYERIDQALESFGWPMGPAHHLDVVGLATASQNIEMVAAGYPQRMELPARNAIRMLVDEQRPGRESGAGLYNYYVAGKQLDRKRSPEARALIGLIQQDANVQLHDPQIVECMMLPTLLEAIRCLEEGVAGSAAEIDFAMLVAASFPAYLGGPLKHADWIGLPRLLARCEALAHNGPMYAPPVLLRKLAASNSKFHEVA